MAHIRLALFVMKQITTIFEINHELIEFMLSFPEKLENRKKVFGFSLMGCL
jgi:hypothetical protein